MEVFSIELSSLDENAIKQDRLEIQQWDIGKSPWKVFFIIYVMENTKKEKKDSVDSVINGNSQ